MVRGELHPQSPVEHEAYRTDHGAAEGLKLHREDPTLNHQHLLMTEHVSLNLPDVVNFHAEEQFIHSVVSEIQQSENTRQTGFIQSVLLVKL